MQGDRSLRNIWGGGTLSEVAEKLLPRIFPFHERASSQQDAPGVSPLQIRERLHARKRRSAQFAECFACASFITPSLLEVQNTRLRRHGVGSIEILKPCNTRDGASPGGAVRSFRDCRGCLTFFAYSLQLICKHKSSCGRRLGAYC